MHLIGDLTFILNPSWGAKPYAVYQVIVCQRIKLDLFLFFIFCLLFLILIKFLLIITRFEALTLTNVKLWIFGFAIFFEEFWWKVVRYTTYPNTINFFLTMLNQESFLKAKNLNIAHMTKRFNISYRYISIFKDFHRCILSNTINKT